MRRSALSPTRRAHEDQLLELLRHHGPLTRGQLSELSGITRSTVSEIVTDMLNRRAITLDGNDTERPGRGRRAERIALDPSAGQYLGIEFAHDGACFQLANASLSVIAQRHCIYPFNAPWDVRLRMARQTIDELSDLPDVAIEAVYAVGVGVAGPSMALSIEHNGQRRSLQDVIRETIHAALSPNATVVVQHNVRLAALAEATWGRKRPLPALLYVEVGSGVGGSTVIGGVAINGASGLAAELGHIDTGLETEVCRCGGTGCLEMVASASALLAAASEVGIAVDSLSDLAQEAADPRLAPVFERVASATARVLTSAVRVIDPTDLVIAGEVFAALPQLCEEIIERVRSVPLTRRFGSLRLRKPDIVIHAGALGGIQAVVDLPRLPFSPPDANHLTAAPIPLGQTMMR